MLQVEAEVPDVEITRHDVAIEGVPLATAVGQVSTVKTFTQEHPALELPEGFDTSVRPTKVELTLKSGGDSFDFISVLRVTMRGEDGGEAVELINYEKPAGATIGRTLSIPCTNAADVAHLLANDKSVFDLEVAGTLPVQSWSLDISVHFSAKASYSY
jgi:hypothetical protein